MKKWIIAVLCCISLTCFAGTEPLPKFRNFHSPIEPSAAFVAGIDDFVAKAYVYSNTDSTSQDYESVLADVDASVRYILTYPGLPTEVQRFENSAIQQGRYPLLYCIVMGINHVAACYDLHLPGPKNKICMTVVLEMFIECIGW